MAGISINLLPVQSRIDQKAQKKFRIIQTLSIVILLTLFFLASLVSALNILKSNDVSKLESEANVRETKVLEFKEKEAQLAVLKNRLSLINKINNAKATSNSDIYRSVLSLFPKDLNISSISVDRSGNVVTAFAAPDFKTLEETLTSLTSDKVLEIISQIDIDSLSRSRDGIYRANLKIQK